jgi:hypothetical protein
LAGEVEVIKNLKAVADIGMDRNFNRESNRRPAFAGSIICSIPEDSDIDFGVRRGPDKPETDFAILLGIALRF